MDTQNDTVGFDLNSLANLLSEGAKAGGAALQQKLDSDAAQKVSDQRYKEAVAADEAAVDARSAASNAELIAKASGSEADKVKAMALQAVARVAEEEQDRTGVDLPADARTKRVADAVKRATVATKNAADAAVKAAAAPTNGALKAEAQLKAERAKAAQATLVKVRSTTTLDPQALASIQAQALADSQSSFPWVGVAVGVGVTGLVGTALYFLLRRRG